MKSYVTILRGSVTTAEWKCESTHPSDEMATEYWARQLTVDPCAAGAMSAYVYGMPEQKLIAAFSIRRKTEARAMEL